MEHTCKSSKSYVHIHQHNIYLAYIGKVKGFLDDFECNYFAKKDNLALFCVSNRENIKKGELDNSISTNICLNENRKSRGMSFSFLNKTIQ